MRCSLSLPFVVIASTAWCADAPKPIALSPKDTADGWIQLFDGSTTFGWKVQGDVAVGDGVMVFGGSKSASITTTSSFGPAELRVSYQVEGNQPVLVTWHGLTKFCGPGSEKWQELTWPSNETYIPTTPLLFAGG